MLRRRLLLGRPMVRRPILGAALVGGLAYMVGRRSSVQAGPASAIASPSDETRARLRELDQLRTDGAISNDEYQARRGELLGTI